MKTLIEHLKDDNSLAALKAIREQLRKKTQEALEAERKSVTEKVYEDQKKLDEAISAKGLKHVAAHYGYRKTEHPDTYRNAGGGEIKHSEGRLHHSHSRSGQRSFSSLNDLGKHLSDVHQTKMDLGYDAGEKAPEPKHAKSKKPKKSGPEPEQQSLF